VDEAHPGVRPIGDLKDGEEKKYHKYYQWVCFCLFFQAIIFYIPRYGLQHISTLSTPNRTALHCIAGICGRCPRRAR
jgi:hypothetical protein